MIYKFQYETETDRQTIIDKNKEKILIENQCLFEGNFLVYSDTPRIEDSVKEIKNNTDILLLKQEGIL